jgi:Fe-S cluster assembly ATP-binding protein
MELNIQDLHINVKDKEIVKGVSLIVKQGEIVVIMGPNGSGKSTLANTIMGHPNYTITQGKILSDNIEINSMKPHERAKLGLFLSFQYPSEITGVTITNFLRTTLKELKGENIPIPEFMTLLKQKMASLRMDPSFAKRYLNEGFSGGEKKRNEILQLSMLEPKIALLDETDSGLDVDALKIVAQGVEQLVKNNNMGALVVTHYQRLLHYLKPDKVHIMIDGKIVKSGGPELAKEVEEKGYDWLKVEA